MYTEKKITSIKTQNKEIKMIKVIKKKIVHTTVQFIHDLKKSWHSCIIKIKHIYSKIIMIIIKENKKY